MYVCKLTLYLYRRPKLRPIFQAGNGLLALVNPTVLLLYGWGGSTHLWHGAVLFTWDSGYEELTSNHHWRITIAFPHIVSSPRSHARHLEDAQCWSASDTWRTWMKRRHQQSAVIEAKSSGKSTTWPDQRGGRNESEVSYTWTTSDRHFDVRVVKLVALAYLQQIIIKQVTLLNISYTE